MSETPPTKLELLKLKSLFSDASLLRGEDFLKEMVKGLGDILGAETTFVARGLDRPTTKVRALAAWKNGAFKTSWDYDLAGNPCMLTYDGKATFIPCDLESQFPKKKGFGYDSYIGIPLNDEAGDVIGHIAIYSSKARQFDGFTEEMVELCKQRAEAEAAIMMRDQAAAE